MPGPAPQPTKLRKLKGNTAHKAYPANEPDPKEASGYCPRHLSDIARKEWRRVTPELRALGLFTIVDRAALEAYCECYATWRQAKELLRTEGLTFKTDKGYLTQRPEVSIANNALKLMKGYLIEFGMTPSSRTRVTAAPKKTSKAKAVDDEFSTFLRENHKSTAISGLSE